MSTLESELQRLRPSIEGWRDERLVAGLFTDGAGASVHAVREDLLKVPDWLFRRDMNKFLDTVETIRGGRVTSESGDLILTRTQKQKLAQAERLQDRLIRRINLSARKGLA